MALTVEEDTGLGHHVVGYRDNTIKESNYII